MTGTNTRTTSDTITQPLSPKEFFPVAEGLHILNRQVYEAVTTRDREALLALAGRHLGSGARGLAVSLGTGKKMAEITPWVVESLIQGTDARLFLSANILDHPELLRRFGNRIVINAVTAEADTLTFALESARQHEAGLVVLLVRPGLTPIGLNDRLMLAADVIEQAVRAGLHPNRLLLDPILSCRPDPNALKMSRGLPDVGIAAETVCLIKQINPDVRTIVGLGAGQPSGRETHGWMRQSILTLLLEAGLDAAIMNCLDLELMRTVQSHRAAAYPSGAGQAAEGVSRAA